MLQYTSNTLHMLHYISNTLHMLHYISNTLLMLHYISNTLHMLKPTMNIAVRSLPAAMLIIHKNQIQHSMNYPCASSI